MRKKTAKALVLLLCLTAMLLSLTACGGEEDTNPIVSEAQEDIDAEAPVPDAPEEPVTADMETEPEPIAGEEPETVGDFVASGTCGNNLTWSLDSGGTLTISGTGEMEDYEYYYYEGEDLSDAPWYDWREDITAVILNSGVTSIGEYAFYDYDSLLNVMIPDSVTSIGEQAFRWCDSLSNVTMGNGITNLGERAFCNCTGLTSITIPGSVTSMGVYVFAACKNLTDVTINSGATIIGEGTFSGCSNLAAITIPSSVVTIEKMAFADCDNLTDVYFSGSKFDWAAMDIANGTCLSSATKHYDSPEPNLEN